MRSYSAAAPGLCLLALAVAFGGCASVESPQEEVFVTPQPAAVVTTEGVVTVPTEIATLHPAFVTAWQGTDPAALRVYFADGAVVETPSGQFTGWDDINLRWLTPLLPGMTNYTLTPTTFTTEGTDIIIESGNYSYRVTREDTAEDLSGTYTHRWQRQPDGTWRLVSVNIR